MKLKHNKKNRTDKEIFRRLFTIEFPAKKFEYTYFNRLWKMVNRYDAYKKKKIIAIINKS